MQAMLPDFKSDNCIIAIALKIILFDYSFLAQYIDFRKSINFYNNQKNKNHSIINIYIFNEANIKKNFNHKT